MSSREIKEPKEKDVKEKDAKEKDAKEKDAKERERDIKRRPGRPRKKELKEPQKKHGLLVDPTDDKNLVEMMYDKPTNFKKICSYWKSLNAENIKFVFTSTQLIMHACSYKKTTNASITCDGSKINQYHCSKDITIEVNFANLELVLSKLDRSFESISFIIQKKTQNKTLHIILQTDVNISEYFELDLIIDTAKGTFTFDDRVPYALEFCLLGKYFKKMISDTDQFDKQWTIEKFGTANLQFKYCSSNAQVKATVVPKSSKDIALKSTIKPDEIFSVSVYIDAVKPTSSSQLADVILIRAAKDRPLWIRAELDDKVIVVNVLIDIVDLRAKNDNSMD
jgi:hypothetical protein